MSIISRVLLNVCVISCWEITDPIYWFFEKQKFLYYLFCYVIIIRQPFPSGERVTFTGKEVLCPKCVQIPVMTATPSPPMKPVRSSPTPSSPASNGGANTPSSSTRNYSIRWQNNNGQNFINKSFSLFLCCYCCLECTGCSKEIVEGQALIALDSQWHVWCFKCVTCNTLLHGEYMGKYVGNKSFYHRLPLHCQFFYRRGSYLLIFSSLDGIFCYLITDTMCLIT